MRLPPVEDLTRNQRDIIDLPLVESHLITGAPGSGKSVMAVHRANMLSSQGRPTMLLMYNKTLRMYTQNALEELNVDDSVVSGWIGWFKSWFQKAFGVRAPLSGGLFTFDWPRCIEIALENSDALREDLKYNVIVDEGQDMPREFWQFIGTVTKTVTVFADENQIITDNNSTVNQIMAVAGIQHRHHLQLNFRNTPAIARVAGHFYIGAGSPPAEISDSIEDGDAPTLSHHTGIDETIQTLKNYERNNSGKSIGLFFYYKNNLKTFYERLTNTYNNVERYYYGIDETINFASPGLKLVTIASCKGLEFDTVFIPELQTHKITDGSAETFRRRMYVMCSRARTELHMIYSGEGDPDVINHLPLEDMDDLR